MFKSNHKNIQFKLSWITRKILNNNSNGSNSDYMIIAIHK